MKEKISKKQLREFSILIGFGIPILIGWLIPFLMGHGFRVWTVFIGIPSLTLGLISPRLLYYPYKGWMSLGNLLGWINSRIILGLVFISVLQPIAFLMKLSGYDPLRKNIRKNKLNSYKELRGSHRIDLTRIF